MFPLWYFLLTRYALATEAIKNLGPILVTLLPLDVTTLPSCTWPAGQLLGTWGQKSWLHSLQLSSSSHSQSQPVLRWQPKGIMQPCIYILKHIQSHKQSWAMLLTCLSTQSQESNNTADSNWNCKMFIKWIQFIRKAVLVSCCSLSNSHVVPPLSFKCFRLSTLSCSLLNGWIVFCDYYHKIILPCCFPSLRFLHQLWILSNKEAAFAVNEASKLHLSGIHLISSLFPPKSAAFLHVPVSLGRARTGKQASIMANILRKQQLYCMYELHDPNTCHALLSVQWS